MPTPSEPVLVGRLTFNGEVIEDGLMAMIEHQRVLISLQSEVILTLRKELRNLRMTRDKNPRMTDEQIVERAEAEGLVPFVRALLGAKI